MRCSRKCQRCARWVDHNPKSPASKRTDRRVNSDVRSSQCVPPLPRRGSVRPHAANIVRPAIRTHPASCVINVPLSSSFVTQGCNHAMNTSWNTAHRYIGWISLIGVRLPPPPRVFVFFAETRVWFVWFMFVWSSHRSCDDPKCWCSLNQHFA